MLSEFHRFFDLAKTLPPAPRRLAKKCSVYLQVICVSTYTKKKETNNNFFKHRVVCNDILVVVLSLYDFNVPSTTFMIFEYTILSKE